MNIEKLIPTMILVLGCTLIGVSFKSITLGVGIYLISILFYNKD